MYGQYGCFVSRLIMVLGCKNDCSTVVATAPQCVFKFSMSCPALHCATLCYAALGSILLCDYAALAGMFGTQLPAW